jgi:hypothetical protein
MSDIFGYVVISLALFIVAVKIAITLSPRFRRWVYSKDRS